MSLFERRSAGVPTLLVALTAALMACHLSPARADDAERLRTLEEQVRALTEEIKALKDQAARNPSTHSVPSTGAAVSPPPGGGAVGSDEVQRTQERIEALEQRAAQQDIQARFGEGIILEDPRGDWSLRLGGRVQLDYRHFSPDGVIADTFSLRRARLGVDATLLRDYRVVVDAEYATGNASGATAQNVALTLGYLDIGTFAPGARLRLGQFKPAFGYEQTLQDLYSDYMERSFGQSLLQNLNYDRGMMLYGAPRPGLWYGVTLSNGVGQNLEEKQGSSQEVDASKPEFTARLAGNLAQLLEVSGTIVQGGTSFKRGEVANSASNPYVAASVQTEARGVTFFTPAAFNAAGQSAENVDRRHWAYEFLLSRGPVKFQGEHFQVSYYGTRTSPAPALGFKRTLKAGYLSAMWLVTGEHYADFFRDSGIGKIRPRNRFSRGPDGGWGALELGLRYSTFDGTAFSDTNPARTGQLGATAPVSTSAREASAVTLQAKWIPNLYTRFWLDLVRTEFETPVMANGVSVSHENALAMRAQMDF